MGEGHHVKEFRVAQYQIIEHVILQNPDIKNFQLLLESPPFWNYYLDNLILEDDSVGFRKMLRRFLSSEEDTLHPLLQGYYDFFMKFYYLSKSLENRTFRFKCVDNGFTVEPIAFTILDIFEKYSVQDASFLAQITFLDSLVHNENLHSEFSKFHQHFGSFFTENRDLLKDMLTEREFHHLSEMIRRSLPHYSKNLSYVKQVVTQERENSMFEQINNSYHDSIFSFCIIGANHIRKPYRETESKLLWKSETTGKAISVGKMLETYKESHFKNKIILCDMFALARNVRIYKQDNSYMTFKKSEPYPVVFQKYSDYLNSLLLGNITLINMRKTDIKRAYKITDYMLVVKEANEL
ncbi:MAG: hypothetical protein LBV02_02805 [Bacteroidales bacterium]|nr:hypothetical protein [Bacteroidales bacterium]